MADLFDGYPLGSSGTRCSAGRRSRPAYAGLFASLQPIDGEELAARADLLSQTYRDAGVAFAHAGEEQPFRSTSCRGSSAPRSGTSSSAVGGVHALEAFLADVYGAGRGVRRPDRAAQRRATSAALPPAGARAGPAERRPGARLGIDLVRDEAGDFRVLEDNLRSPSGVSYVITNRAAMSQVLPELFADHRIQPVADYLSKLLAALKASAPSNVAEPTVVVLTPGVYNSAYFEHALLARQMGVELVEGRDLVARATRSACGRRTVSAAST